VEVVSAGAVACRQRSLFAAGGGGEAREVDALLDRLSGRLGRAAVFEPKPVADAQPEHAWMVTAPGSRSGVGADRPAVASGSGRQEPRLRDRIRRGGARADSHGGPAAAGRRPIWMPPRPVRLEPLRTGLVSVAPDGPPVRFRLGEDVHAIAQAYGPERIETAWWRGPTVRRDYYVVETESGARFWLFRRLKDGAWFLHGMFA
jgi:protein ImuB